VLRTEADGGLLITSSYLAPSASKLVYVTDVGATGGVEGDDDLVVPLLQATKPNAKIAIRIAERNKLFFIKSSFSYDSPNIGLNHVLFHYQHKPAMFLKIPHPSVISLNTVSCG
jgi:hypothetical protein